MQLITSIISFLSILFLLLCIITYFENKRQIREIEEEKKKMGKWLDNFPQIGIFIAVGLLIYFSPIVAFAAFDNPQSGNSYPTEANTSKYIKFVNVDSLGGDNFWLVPYVGNNYPNDFQCRFRTSGNAKTSITCGTEGHAEVNESFEIGDDVSCYYDGTDIIAYVNDIEVTRYECSVTGGTDYSGVYSSNGFGFDSYTFTAPSAPTSTPTPTPTNTPTPTAAPTPTPATVIIGNIPTSTEMDTPEIPESYKHIQCIYPTLMKENESNWTKSFTYTQMAEMLAGGSVNCDVGKECSFLSYKYPQITIGNDFELSKMTIYLNYRRPVANNRSIYIGLKSGSGSTKNTSLTLIGDTNNNTKDNWKTATYVQEACETEFCINNDSKIGNGITNEIELYMGSQYSGSYFSSDDEIKSPYICFEWYDDNPEYAEPTSDTILTDLNPQTCPASKGIFDLNPIFCHFKNWLIRILKYLFIPTQSDAIRVIQGFKSFRSGLDNDLVSIVAKPLDFINEITKQTCSDLTIPLPFLDDKEVSLPCPRALLISKFEDIMDIWDLISTGFISYWIVIGLFNQVKGANNPDDDRIKILDI